ncbi:fatty-acyl-CoA synthase [Cohaesibacter sp. ES.047]|uniref:acyl-CoA synthetase n=1 Tax=Cohaesibacter sp. ES.047 TaxID=1798205 RepID=UPI000BB7ADE5|nr:acyl-CoA synthetase [Cohaesibacter sp. ES.047]SNY90946.1 fatty-acyl-CoA synthase [Cohaesibacter sp. ES.047]
MSNNPFSKHLDQNPANYVPLSPVTFLERAALTYPDHTAWVHGQTREKYADFYTRCRQLASALSSRGIGRGDVVSVMLPNVPSMLEIHYAAPMIGAVLHAINTRLDPPVIAFQLEHAQTKLIIIDTEYAEAMKDALAIAEIDPVVVQYSDPEFAQEGPWLGELDYESLVKEGDPTFDWPGPVDEWDAIALNYTSGTTGDPKGVVYHHRGAYLMGYANIVSAKLSHQPVYLWTLPMFHCNGWCFPWSLSVVAGTHVCLRAVRAKPIFKAINEEGVTHLCGAPIVMSTLLNAPDEDKQPLPHTVEFITAAAPPPEAILAGMTREGFQVTHVYGLTETYGPSVINEWKEDWNELSPQEQASKKARQGVRYPALEGLSVRNPATMEPVAPDGDTIGEVMFRGNIVMKGYFRNEGATNQAFYDGWFHSGDLAVMHPDGYIQIKDRSKDIIISGGENISSIEVEDALYKHHDVEAAAVVARPDDKWGETPCAFVELSKGHTTTEEDLFNWCRDHLAHYKVPKTIIFTDLPKTSTGKIQKFLLRKKAKSL